MTDSSQVGGNGQLAPLAPRRPGRPAAAPCHICRKPQPPCPHEGCYRHYSDGHQNVNTHVKVTETHRITTTRCDDCGAGFGSVAVPLDWLIEDFEPEVDEWKREFAAMSIEELIAWGPEGGGD